MQNIVRKIHRSIQKSVHVFFFFFRKGGGQDEPTHDKDKNGEQEVGGKFTVGWRPGSLGAAKVGCLVDRAAVESAVDLSNSKYCPVFGMLKLSANITSNITILEANPQAAP